MTRVILIKNSGNAPQKDTSVLKHKSDSKTYYSCSFLSSTEDGTRYQKLGILNTDLENSHYSKPLLRVLFEAIHKKKELSPACQQVVDQYKDEINFEPCF